MEDFPRWISLAKKGEKFNLLDKVTIKYRISENAISTNNASIEYKKSQAIVFLKYQFRPNFSEEPRSAIYKYFCVKFFVTQSKRFLFYKRVFILFDRLYCRLTQSKRIYWWMEEYFM